MKKFLFLFACAILCACDHTEPVTPSGGGGSTTANVDFVYQMSGLFTYKFTNTSTGCSSYKWDFGDGESSTTKNATHKYASEGAYTVTLTGTANGNKYRCSKKISVKKPSIYVAGYKLYRIPYQNKYYKLIMYDDDWFGTDWGFQTVYTPLLDNSDLPYVKEFNNPNIMDKLDGIITIMYKSNIAAIQQAMVHNVCCRNFTRQTY